MLRCSVKSDRSQLHVFQSSTNSFGLSFVHRTGLDLHFGKYHLLRAIEGTNVHQLHHMLLAFQRCYFALYASPSLLPNSHLLFMFVFHFCT